MTEYQWATLKRGDFVVCKQPFCGARTGDIIKVVDPSLKNPTGINYFQVDLQAGPREWLLCGATYSHKNYDYAGSLFQALLLSVEYDRKRIAV